MMKKKTKGFTLAELLVVVAIISSLVAISIPIFLAQKAKAELATCQANRRALRAEMVIDYLSENFLTMGDAFTSIYTEKKLEYVCPRKGEFYWDSTNSEDGKIKCKFHDHDQGGGSGGGGNVDEIYYPGTDVKLWPDFWPTADDFTSVKPSITLQPGPIFKYGSEYYVVIYPTAVDLTDYDRGPNRWGIIKLTGKILAYVGNETQLVSKGDLCKSGNDYFVCGEEGGQHQSPELNSWSWKIVPKDGHA